MKQSPQEGTRQVESVAKALVILECFIGEDTELSLKDISEKTGLYKSRILRLCGTLVANGFLIRLQRSAYKLGPKLMTLGKTYERANPLTAISRPILRELSAVTGESTKIFIIEGHKRLCLVREKGTHPLHYVITEGETMALHAGAGGKVLLAYAPEAFRQDVLNRTLEKITSVTVVERDRLEKQFETIRRQGYCFSRGEMVPDVGGLAAPVFDYNNQACAALAISGPIQRFSDGRRKEMIRSLKAGAQKLSTLLGNIEDV